MSQEYANNRITKADLKSREREIRKTPKEKRLGKFHAYRHYGALRHSQEEGYHHLYLTGIVDGRTKKTCTCGLVIYMDEQYEQFIPSEELKLDPVQMVDGHRRLPDCEGRTIALIVTSNLDESRGKFIQDAYCQGCLEVVKAVSGKEADAFVERHNSTCLK